MDSSTGYSPVASTNDLGEALPLTYRRGQAGAGHPCAEAAATNGAVAGAGIGAAAGPGPPASSASSTLPGFEPMRKDGRAGLPTSSSAAAEPPVIRALPVPTASTAAAATAGAAHLHWRPAPLQGYQQLHQDGFQPLMPSLSSAAADLEAPSAGAAAAAAAAAPAAPSTPPLPPSRAVIACYFLLGAGLLAAWNALITATDYFGAVYPGYHTDRVFTLAYLPLCLITMALGLRFSEQPPPSVRIRLGFIGFTIAMAAVPLVDAVMVQPSEVGAEVAPAPVAGLVAAVACVALVGACDGFCQGALFGEVAQLPPPCTHAVVMGTASSGFLICLLRLLSKASFEAASSDRAQGLRNGTRLYFALAGLLSLCCLIVYDGVLPRLRKLPLRQPAEAAMAPYSSVGFASTAHGTVTGRKSSVQQDDELAQAQDHVCERRPLLVAPPQREGLSCPPEGEQQGGASQCAAASVWGPAGASAAGTVGGAADGAAMRPIAADGGKTVLPSAAVDGAAGSTAGCSGGAVSGAGERLRIRRCLLLAWPLCAAVFSTYAVTLTIFPGFLAEDVHSAELGDWYPILLITAFNLADLVGKSLPPLEPLRDRTLDPALPPPSELQGGPPTGPYEESTSAFNHHHDHRNPDYADLQQAPLLSPSLGPPEEEMSLQGVRGPGGGHGGGGSGAISGCCRLAGGLLRPRRRPRGLLAAALLRGLCALPAFLTAAWWGAPAWVMAALTAALGVSNGYLTSQILTMGPGAVLDAALPQPPLKAPHKAITPESTSPAAASKARAPARRASSGRDAERCRLLPAMELVEQDNTAAARMGPAAGCQSSIALLQPCNGSSDKAQTLGSSIIDGRGIEGGSGKGQVGGSEAVIAAEGADVSAVVEFREAVDGACTDRQRDAEVVETLLVLSLIAGLNVGAYLGWLWLL